MTKRAGLLFNWSIALGAYAVAGPLWAAIAFLLVALVRMTLELQTLRRHHTELKRVVSARGAAFGLGDFASTSQEVMPESEARPLRVSQLGLESSPFREKMASQAN